MNPRPFAVDLTCLGCTASLRLAFARRRFSRFALWLGVDIVRGRLEKMKRAPGRCWMLAIAIGIASAVAYFLVVDRWARVGATGEPKFEVSAEWLLGESLIVAVLVSLLAGGIVAGMKAIAASRRG